MITVTTFTAVVALNGSIFLLGTDIDVERVRFDHRRVEWRQLASPTDFLEPEGPFMNIVVRLPRHARVGEHELELVRGGERWRGSVRLVAASSTPSAYAWCRDSGHGPAVVAFGWGMLAPDGRRDSERRATGLLWPPGGGHPLLVGGGGLSGPLDSLPVVRVVSPVGVLLTPTAPSVCGMAATEGDPRFELWDPR